MMAKRMNKFEWVSAFAHKLHSPKTAWVILIFGLIITGAAWYVSSNFVQERARDRFADHVEDLEQALLNRMNVYEQLLWSGVGLFSASEHVSREEWRDYVVALQIDKHWPGIQGMGYAIPLKPEEVEAHEASVRAEGFPDYAIKPAGPRSEYSSIVYLEPFDWRNQRAFGYDMWSNEMRRAAMARARDTGEASTSGLITLVQETDKDVQRGFLTYVPFYEKGMPTGTVEERRAAFKGWVYSPFRMGDLMKASLGGQSRNLHFQIFDGDSMEPEAMLYDSFLTRPDNFTPRFRATRTVELQGRYWTLFFEQSDQAVTGYEHEVPNFIAIGGLVIDIFLFYIITSMAYLQRRAEHIAEGMTDDYKKSLELLLASEERFALATQGSSVGIWDWKNVEQNDEYWSPQFYKLLGYKPGEIDANLDSFTDLLYPDDREKTFGAVEEHFKNKTPFNVEYRLRHKSGAYRWFLGTAQASWNSHGEAVRMVGSIQDIHDRKIAQNQLREHVDELARSNADLEQFAYIASHDLKAPLRGIANLVEWIEENIEETADQETRSYMDLLKKRVERMDSLLDGLLKYCRAGNESLSTEKISLNQTLDKITDMLGCLERGFDVHYNLPPIVAVPMEIEMIFHNLIGNAVKHHDKKNGRVVITCTEEGKGYLFSVWDDGPGIPLGMHDKVFGIFQTLNRRDQVEGSGIGLAIVKKVIERRGGNIWIERTDEERGTEIRFTLPTVKYEVQKSGLVA